MGKLSKNELLAQVMNLRSIIEHINSENCCDEIVKFFTITSSIQDRAQEIEELLPVVEGKMCKFFGWKSDLRKKSETRRFEAEKGFKNFMYEINKAGRNPYGYNRTELGEPITKDKLFFGDRSGINTITVKKLEECKKDLYVQEIVRFQIVDFVKSYKASFNTDWLQ